MQLWLLITRVTGSISKSKGYSEALYSTIAFLKIFFLVCLKLFACVITFSFGFKLTVTEQHSGSNNGPQPQSSAINYFWVALHNRLLTEERVAILFKNRHLLILPQRSWNLHTPVLPMWFCTRNFGTMCCDGWGSRAGRHWTITSNGFLKLSLEICQG